ncbi:hypothetical protein HY632_04435, partial [Candidatus Uhrbacteria bacterium]|nr:hypothetical protein [Candidatus Uhrbacteria bacterium]
MPFNCLATHPCAWYPAGNLDMLFQNPTLGSILFDDVIQTIANFVQSDPQQHYEVTIGSDSEQHHDIVECISAIVVHRVGCGARYFWMRTEHLPFPALRERIWHEAILSTTLAKSVLEALIERAD